MATPNMSTQPKPITSGSALDLMKPAPLPGNASLTSTAPGAPQAPAPNMSVAPKPAALPIAMSSAVSPVSTSAPAQQAQNQVRQAAAAATPSTTVTVAGATLRTGLKPEQVQSIQTLSTKPTDQWTTVDKENWGWATNNAPLPAPKKATPTPTPTATAPTPTPAPAPAPSTAPKTAPAAAPAPTAAPKPAAAPKAPLTVPPPKAGIDMEPIDAADAAAKAAASEADRIRKEYEAAGKAVDTFTDEENAQIKKAGEDAGKRFDPAIAAAREEKRQQMARDLINAGQRGGFQSTQFAGVGAFTQTVGGTFVGAGGLLARNEDLYSAAIAQLETEKIAAIAQGEQLRQEAIRTGKKEDLDRMQTSFAMANEIADRQTQIANQKFDRATKLQELARYEKQDAMETLAAIAEAGYAPEDMPEEYAVALERSANMPDGFVSQMLTTSKQKRDIELAKDESERQAREIQTAGSMASLFDKMGVGGQIKLGEQVYTYQGYNTEDIMQGSETDQNTGEVTAWTYNVRTKERTAVSLGVIGTKKDGWETQKLENGEIWFVNSQTQQAVPAYASPAQESWSDAMPNGSSLEQLFEAGDIGPILPGGDPANAGQCGAFNNYCYGTRIVPNSYEDKITAMGQYKVEKDQVRVGDSFLMEAGDTGHVGIVNSVERGPDGKVVLRLSESNYVPPNGKKISHTRTMSIDDKRLTMISRIPTPNLPKAGPDAPAGRQILGASNKGGYSVADVATFAASVRAGDLPASQVPDEILLDVLRTAQTTKTAGIDIPTFDDFARNIQESAGMSMDPGRLQQMYSQTVGRIPPILDAASVVTASNAFSKDSRAATIKGIENAINSGDIPGAQEQLKKAAINSVAAAEQDKIRGREIGIRQLSNIQDLLEEYKAAGGSTGIFKGTEQAIREKAGQVGDPKLRQIASNIALTLIDYRKSVSGAAFTESEGAEYKALFPSIDNTFDLSTAKIDALINGWRNGNDAFYESVITPSLYQQVFK